MASSAAAKVERIVGSFASLMSSALTLSNDNSANPLKSSSDVLPKFISPSVGPDGVCMVIPSLMLKHGETSGSSGASLEESVALNLARQMDVTASQVEVAPMVLLANFSDSFKSLIDSRLRSSIQALVRQSHRQTDPTLTRVLVGLLACSQSPIAPSAVVTSFRTLSACELTPNGEIVMPMVMEAVVDIKIFGNLASVTIVAPGTITTAFARDFLISKTEIVLDTLAFLQSMMKQARFAVRKAVATASTLATNILMPSSRPDGNTLSYNSNNSISCHRNDDVNNNNNNNIISKRSSSNMTMQQLNQVSSSQSLKQLLSGQSSQAPVAPESSSFLMPPPPSRPSKRSLADLTKSSTSDLNESGGSLGGPNANWMTNSSRSSSETARQRAIASGLSLLTKAASINDKAQEQEGSEKKKQRTDDFSRPRKVTTCPRLEAAV